MGKYNVLDIIICKSTVSSSFEIVSSEVAWSMNLILWCVSGASGYIASWLVKLLLQHGYTVKATVRNPNNLTKTGHLLALDGAKERLHLFKADLVEEGSFDSVIEGCDGVFHTASPVAVEVSDPQAELIDPALRGTINILRSCAKVPSVKRVVVTSSMATVVFNGKSLTPDVLVDESWFSNPLLLEQSKLWYMLSKTLAEEAAWKFAKENEVLKLIKGAQTFPNTPYTWVDVRDVANAHIQAYELLEASGRFCLVETVSDSSETLKILHKFYPALHISEKPADDTPYVPAFQVSQEKAKGLGIHFTPLEVSLKDTIESLKENNLISF
ncbi:unnamed protein product, partial [Vitis vinifera]